MSQQAPPDTDTGRKLGLAIGGGATLLVGLLILLIALPMLLGVVGVLAAIAIPNFVVMQYRAKRAEVPANVQAIQTAEMAYDASFDEFISAPTAPAWDIGKHQSPWPRDAPGFSTLGWAPDGEVRGAYWVEVVDGGNDFIVYGVSDVDGDGIQATFTATKSINPTMITSNSIY